VNIFCLGEYFFPDFSTNLESIRKGGERKEKNTLSQCLERESRDGVLRPMKKIKP